MTDLEVFKKLFRFQEKGGYSISIDNSEVCLIYEDIWDDDELECCRLMFVHGSHDIYDFADYGAGGWTVTKLIDIDWENDEP